MVAKNIISKLEPAKYKYCEILKYFKLLNIRTKPKNTQTNNEDNVQNRVLIKKKKTMIWKIETKIPIVANFESIMCSLEFIIYKNIWVNEIKKFL